MKIYVIVDMQNDFITGSLAADCADFAVNAASSFLLENVTNEDLVIFTKDTHDEKYLQTQEGRKLPIPHCIKGEWGWKIDDKIEESVYKCKPVHVVAYEKAVFGSDQVVHCLENFVKGRAVDEIVFMGICTDICVVSNVLMAKSSYGLKDTEISVFKDGCAGTTEENHLAAIEVMRSCQVNII